PVKAPDEFRITHAQGKDGAGRAVRRHLEHDLADAEAVAHRDRAPLDAANGQVFAKGAGRDVALQFVRPPEVVVAEIDIDCLVAAAVMLAIHHRVAGYALAGDGDIAFDRVLVDAGLAALAWNGLRLADIDAGEDGQRSVLPAGEIAHGGAQPIGPGTEG